MAVPRRKNLDQRPYVLKIFNVCAWTCAVSIYSISSDNRLCYIFLEGFWWKVVPFWLLRLAFGVTLQPDLGAGKSPSRIGWLAKAAERICSIIASWTGCISSSRNLVRYCNSRVWGGKLLNIFTLFACPPPSLHRTVFAQDKLMKEKRSLREQLEKMQDQMQRMDICLHFQELQRTSLQWMIGEITIYTWLFGVPGFNLFCFFFKYFFLAKSDSARMRQTHRDTSNSTSRWRTNMNQPFGSFGQQILLEKTRFPQKVFNDFVCAFFTVLIRNLCNSSWSDGCKLPKKNAMQWSNGYKMRVGNLTGRCQCWPFWSCFCSLEHGLEHPWTISLNGFKVS